MLGLHFAPTAPHIANVLDPLSHIVNWFQPPPPPRTLSSVTALSETKTAVPHLGFSSLGPIGPGLTIWDQCHSKRGKLNRLEYSPNMLGDSLCIAACQLAHSSLLDAALKLSYMQFHVALQNECGRTFMVSFVTGDVVDFFESSTCTVYPRI